MKILWDATYERLYPIAGQGLTSGTVRMVREIAAGLAARGHTVHVVCNDMERDEQRGERLYYWPVSYHPTAADVVVMTQNVIADGGYDAPVLVLATVGTDPDLGPGECSAIAVDAFPVFSQVHADLLRKARPSVPAERCHVTGLGVDLAAYGLGPFHKLAGEPDDKYGHKYDEFYHQPGRLLFANDPARGLWHVLDVFDLVRKEIPEATLHVAYDFERQMSPRCWQHDQLAQYLWECKERLANTPGVVSLGELTPEQIVREQLECQVHVYPSDPPGVGTQIHGLMQLECAAAGCALVLSDVEAFPEVFGAGATILPVIGRYLPDQERRVDAADYAAIVVELMKDPAKWAEASRKARALAEANTWDDVVTKWERMLEALRAGN